MGYGTNADEEISQLQEIIKEKDQMIDMLTKEKNYYAKKCEQNTKQQENKKQCDEKAQ